MNSCKCVLGLRDTQYAMNTPASRTFFYSFGGNANKASADRIGGHHRAISGTYISSSESPPCPPGSYTDPPAPDRGQR